METELPWPSVLLIKPGQESGYFLYRFTRDGDFAGDTWHLSVEEAKDQADFEFGGELGVWRDVPEGVKDVIAFALHEGIAMAEEASES